MVYDIKFTKGSPLIKNHLMLGGDNSKEIIEVSNKYIIRNGKPWFPMMGEYHYSRANKSEWRTELLKMKAGGISIVASYVIWIHHEELEGEYKFSDNCDIREFVKTCYDCGLHVLLRIGPWVHGEVKYGGFPEWLVKKGIPLRCNNPEYLSYCKKWYGELANQLEGLMFKDGNSLLGVQIENELQRDAQHLETLLGIAKGVGFDAPLYTATAWGIPTDADLPEKIFLPVFGAYTERPWAGHINKCEPVKHYFFSEVRNDHTIGADLIPSVESGYGNIDYSMYPYATCEMGGGIQNTYIRRGVLDEYEIPSLTVTKIGCGNCLSGYYVYHGGRNPVGKTGTLQESRKSGYPNDLPAIDYSYQGAIGAWGTPNIHYGGIRVCSMFLEHFGDLLADCDPVFPDNKITSVSDCETLRYCNRDNDGRGFIFINNYSRCYPLKNHTDVRFKIGERIFPEFGIKVDDCDYGILPYNLPVGNVIISFATVQPLCINDNTWFFFKAFDKDYIYLDKTTVDTVDGNFSIIEKDDMLVLSEIKSTIKIIDKTGKIIKLNVVTKEQAKHISIHNNKVFLSKCELYSDSDMVYAYDTNCENFDISVFDGMKFKSLETEHLQSFKQKVEFEELDVNLLSHRDLEEFELSSSLRKLWKLKLPEDRNDLILKFDITGDIAQLYADGNLVADMFLNGTEWEVGPDKFLNCETLLLTVSYLEPGGKYMETEKNSGLKIHSINAVKRKTIKVENWQEVNVK